MEKIDYTSLLRDVPPNEFRWMAWLIISMSHDQFKFMREIEYIQIFDNTLDKEITFKL